MNTLNVVDRPDDASRLFYNLLDRDQAKMPDYYLPDAPGIALAGDPLLHAMGYRYGSKRPPGWVKTNGGVFRYLRKFKINSGQIRYFAQGTG
jgi:hypothetical protein